jgi:tRNA U38,U39,U40 pseudouridine synthase TruA
LLSGPESTSVFEKSSAWHISEDLDIHAMKVKPVPIFYLFVDVKFCCWFTDGGLVQKACSILVGHHDFSSFRAAGCQVILSLTIVSAFYCLSKLHGVSKEVCVRRRHVLCVSLLGLYLGLRNNPL